VGFKFQAQREGNIGCLEYFEGGSRDFRADAVTGQN